MFLYDICEGGRGVTNQPSVIASQVIDMRDEQFAVLSVTESDVIHANKKDIPCIFRVVASCMWRPVLRSQVLLLAESESAKNKWIGALTEVHRILRKHQLKDRSVRHVCFVAKILCLMFLCNMVHMQVFYPMEAYDSTLPLIKSALSSAIIDQDRLALGTEEGLYVLELRTDGL